MQHAAPAVGAALFFFFFGWWEKPYMPANLANDSNTSRQIKETSRFIVLMLPAQANTR